jgi:signal transduction histidine kinase
MKRWFARLPIHRKLVAIALLVTTAALVVATAGLLALDLVRFRRTALAETTTLAQVVAENTAAAVTFKDVDAATTTLASVRVRSAVTRACLYLPDGTLFAGYERSPAFDCLAERPAPVNRATVAGTAPVTSNGRIIGTVYIERELTEIADRVVIAGLAGLGMLIAAAAVALLLANRINRTVSAPITQLAAAARALRPDDKTLALPNLPAAQDEIGDLIRAFSEMLRRVQDSSSRLVESNERLREKEAEREQLLAREREASRLKDEFLAAVSHELRTPLNAIVGWVQILATQTADAETTAKAVASIARNARAQTRVIEDLVDVSRIVTGKLTIRFDTVDLRAVIEGALDAVREAARVKALTIRAEVPAQPCFVSGDRDRLQQVVWNLLSNAIRFTPRGGTVSLTIVDDRGAFELTVADTGIGISRAFLPHVFDRFRQADGSMTREHGGLGLGLAIVKELTELHGGSVAAASDGPDRGACFSIRLPRLIESPAAGGAPDLPRPLPENLRGLRVLAVDDNADALEMLSSLLAAAGARVRVAATGEQAVREWEREPADVLICDLAMPLVDGFDVLRSVRAFDAAAGRSTRAIALTAHASLDHQARTHEAGFDSYLSKPFDAADLQRAVLGAYEAT